MSLPSSALSFVSVNEQKCSKEGLEGELGEQLRSDACEGFAAY